MSSSELLRMDKIGKRFGNFTALDGVDLKVNAGEVLAIVGENGAGKSTLMKVLSGAYRADAGQMWLAGQPYHPRDPLDARRKGVAMIYQELSLAPHLSVAENIMLGMEPTKGPMLNWRQMHQTAAKALSALGRPDISPSRPVLTLSVAEQQLVEIARSIAVGCRVLVLDEPTSSLTKADVPRLFELVRSLQAQGHAILYISHFLEEVQQITDRFMVLRDGQYVGDGPARTTPLDEIVRLMVGRNVDELYPRSERKAGEVILSVNGLSAHRKPQSASLALRRGEVLGIAGLVGAGRTELLQALMSLRKVRTGQVKVKAFSGRANTQQRWRSGMGMVSEDRKAEGLALKLSIADNMTLSRLPVWVRGSWQAAASTRWGKLMDLRSRSPWQPIGDLSGGNQQKVAIARLLHHDVDVLLLDEPTRGIDIGSKAKIYQLIDELAGKGKAVLIVSSYLPELLGVCDRIAVMCRGVLGEARAAAGLREHDIMTEATGTTK